MTDTVGDILRTWRRRRRFSQLDLATETEISTRHLSFVESGRSTASREVLLRLAEPLEMPLRDRNRLLLAGGYAPLHSEEPLDGPRMAAVREAVDAVLAGHMPFPALAVDRHWNLVMANTAIGRLIQGVEPSLLEPPVNVLRLTLHPGGLSNRIENLAEWRHHLLGRLRLDADASGDGQLAELATELGSYPFPAGKLPLGPPSAIAVPLVIRDAGSGKRLSLLSTTTVFGTATDVTLSELSLECFFPADADTRCTLLETMEISR